MHQPDQPDQPIQALCLIEEEQSLYNIFRVGTQYCCINSVIKYPVHIADIGTVKFYSAAPAAGFDPDGVGSFL